VVGLGLLLAACGGSPTLTSIPRKNDGLHSAIDATLASHSYRVSIVNAPMGESDPDARLETIVDHVGPDRVRIENRSIPMRSTMLVIEGVSYFRYGPRGAWNEDKIDSEMFKWDPTTAVLLDVSENAEVRERNSDRYAFLIVRSDVSPDIPVEGEIRIARGRLAAMTWRTAHDDMTLTFKYRELPPIVPPPAVTDSNQP
jgi:hypothetical protein